MAKAMPLGVDDAGATQPIWLDKAAQEAYETIGFDFLSFHLEQNTSAEVLRELDRWAERTGTQYLLNQEGGPRTPGDPAVFPGAGSFYQPDPAVLEPAWTSPRFLGMVYDELSHCVTNGGWPTVLESEYAPYFFDAKGHSLLEAYDGNFRNVDTLMRRMYPAFAEHGRQGGRGPIVGAEYVLPILQHVFARAGIVPIPKYLKESVTPIHAAMAMGAARQYGLQYWTCLDLWQTEYPGHTPEDLYSSLLFSYWTGAHRAYVENLNYQGSLYAETPDGIRLSPWGEVVREFRRDYLPAHPRSIRFEDFAPEILIVRFPDSDWGQERTGTWITGWLYGAPDLQRDDQTAYWFRIWSVILHGTLPPIALNYNTMRVPRPYRFFFPANNVAVYDHLANDRALYARARLIFLTGKLISPECLDTLQQLVREQDVTVVAPSHLAPAGLPQPGDAPVARHPDGAGQWIVTDQVDHPDVVALLQPFLGKPDELRYVFGDTEVVFHAPEPGERIRVTTRRQ